MILTSAISGLVIFVISWFYLNSYYTLSVEDTLYNTEAIIRHGLFKEKPKKNKQFVFISTGKDLNLVNDTGAYGNIVVSDRYKIFKFLQAINNAKVKPEFVLLDLQFYYPYTSSDADSIRKITGKQNMGVFLPDKSIDDSLQAEIKKNGRVAVSVLFDKNKIDTPIYKAAYGIADYKTYGTTINKFRLTYPDLKAVSIPCLLNQKMDNAEYSGNSLATFCNRHLCFNYIWPGYYYDEDAVKSDSTYQLYHIGALTGLAGSAAMIESIVKNKSCFHRQFRRRCSRCTYRQNTRHNYPGRYLFIAFKR